MFDIEGLEKCKTCGVFPDILYQKKYISFTCPICGRGSSTHEVHGFEVAIKDWNRYHTNKISTI